MLFVFQRHTGPNYDVRAESDTRMKPLRAKFYRQRQRTGAATGKQKHLTTTRTKNIRNTRHLRNIPGKQEMTIAEELSSLYNFGLEGPVATNWESSCAGQQCTNPSSEPRTTAVCTKPAAERQEEKPGMRPFQHKRSKHARVSRKSAQSSTVAADAAVASDETIDYGREGALGDPLFLGCLGETTATTGAAEGRRHATGQQQSRPK